MVEWPDRSFSWVKGIWQPVWCWSCGLIREIFSCPGEKQLPLITQLMPSSVKCMVVAEPSYGDRETGQGWRRDELSQIPIQRNCWRKQIFSMTAIWGTQPRQCWGGTNLWMSLIGPDKVRVWTLECWKNPWRLQLRETPFPILQSMRRYGMRENAQVRMCKADSSLPKKRHTAAIVSTDDPQTSEYRIWITYVNEFSFSIRL